MQLPDHLKTLIHQQLLGDFVSKHRLILTMHLRSRVSRIGYGHPAGIPARYRRSIVDSRVEIPLRPGFSCAPLLMLAEGASRTPIVAESPCVRAPDPPCRASEARAQRSV